MEALKVADCVCFDVDSTLIRDEGIVLLARQCGAEEKVNEWTSRAMGGAVTFREALSARLELMKPSREQLVECEKNYPLQLSEGVEALVMKLRSRGAEIHLVSGGFRSMIQSPADRLGIRADQVHANRLLFDETTGEYAGFDESEPTSESMGKQVVVERLIASKGFKTVVMIGDGITDMEACPPATAFIGYGGNVVREKVRDGATLFVTHFDQLTSALE